MKPKPKPSRKPRCVNPDCKSKGVEYCRGLCELCYRSLRRLIEVKKVLTWETAEERGICRKTKPFGSKRFPLVVSGKSNK